MEIPEYQYISCPTLRLTASKPHHNIAYLQWGDLSSCDRIVICVHALTGDSTNHIYIGPYLAQRGFCVFALDMIGRGKSDHLDIEDYTYQQYTSDVVTLYNHILSTISPSISHKFYYMGSSMGGLIGMNIYTQYNNTIKFNALFINDIGPYVPKELITFITNYVSVEPKFKTREDAAVYFYKLYGPGFGPRVDLDFFRHRAEYALELKEDILPDGTKDIYYAIGYHRAGVLHGLHSKIDSDSDDYIITDDDIKLISDIDNDKYKYPTPSQEYVSCWNSFVKIDAPLLIYHGTNSRCLYAWVRERMDIYIKSTGKICEVKIWPETGHLPPLYKEDELEPIYQFFSRF